MDDSDDLLTVDGPRGRQAFRRWLLEPVRGNDALGRSAGIARWRRTSGIWLIYLGYPLGELASKSPAQIVLGLLLIAVFCYLYVVPLPRAMFSGPRRDQITVLVGGPLIMAGYLLLIGHGGLVFPTFLAVAVGLLLVPAISLPIVVGMAAAATWLPQYVPSWDVRGAQWATSAPIALVMVAIYAMRAGVRHQIELAHARKEIERLAQQQERLRISRDIHDLLGHALTTITVKAELASRLVTRDPAAAAAEMAQVATLGREGLADVRAAVAGYRQVSLLTELATAREVLTAAGIRAELPAAVEDLPVDLRELFGWVLREAVTNAVRHSGATSVRVVVTDHSIEVTDDGTGPTPPTGPTKTPTPGRDHSTPGTRTRARGSGLTGLAERVAAAGGRLEAGPLKHQHPSAEGAEGHGFRLRATVPA